MKLIIEKSSKDEKVVFSAEGDYEEVLALVTELGFCKDANSTTSNVIINCEVGKQYSQEELASFRC